MNSTNLTQEIDRLGVSDRSSQKDVDVSEKDDDEEGPFLIIRFRQYNNHDDYILCYTYNDCLHINLPRLFIRQNTQYDHRMSSPDNIL